MKIYCYIIEICNINTHTLKFNSCLKAVLFHSKNINYATLRKKKTTVPFKNSFVYILQKCNGTQLISSLFRKSCCQMISFNIFEKLLNL